MGEFGRFDRHAVTRQHVEMRGARECADGGAGGKQGRLNKAPLPPAAFHAPRREDDRGIVLQRIADRLIVRRARATVEMDGNVIPDCGQPTRLRDDPVGILMAQKDIGDLGHPDAATPRYESLVDK